MLNTSILKIIDSKPTLNLDFANAKTLDSRINFTRSSRGTYVASNGIIKLAPVDSPRFDHDFYTKQSKGLLIEESRTNLVSDSAYSASSWTNNFPAGATLTTGIDAPDGTNTAVRFTCNNTTNALLRINLTPFTPNGTDYYTTSFWVRLISGSGLISTDLGDGDPSIDYGSSLVTNKWVRVTVTGVPTATQKSWLDLFSDKNTNYVLDYWGAQLEQGAHATSYIPTSGATATRSADIAFISNNNFSNFYNSNQGSLFVSANNYVGIVTQSNGRNNTIVSINDGTNNNTIEIGLSNNLGNETVISGFTTSGTFTSINSGINVSNNEYFKVAASFKSATNFNSSYNGNTVLSSTGIGTLPTTNQMSIGCGATNLASGFFNSSISKILYYSNVLTNTELQNITT